MKEAMKVLQVCVARTRRVSTAGREAMTAIAKQPVDGPVAFGRLGLQGDEQAYLNVHGGLSKALYACTGEHPARLADGAGAGPRGAVGRSAAARPARGEHP